MPLYVIATPIGNLEDITLRALRLLKEVDFILCEDTRVTVKLLSHYDIHKPLRSFHSYNEARQIPALVEELKHKSAALVSDSGTPAISDPGNMLIKALLVEHVSIVPIPGASSVTTFVSAIGLESKGFYFHGFTSPKPSRRKKELRALFGNKVLLLFLESPFRVGKFLGDACEVFSMDTIIYVGRELTKKFEEIRFFELQYYQDQEIIQKQKGEYIIGINNIKT